MNPMVDAVVAKALDGLSLRYEAIAQNIANGSTPRYRPVSVDFEASLRRAAADTPDAVRSVPLHMRSAAAVQSEPRLDLAIADAAEVSMRYAALLDMFGRRLAISRAALGTGG